MVFQESTEDSANAVYRIEIIDSEGRGLEFSATAGNANPAIYEALFQALVNAVEAAETITLSYAQRRLAALQQVTPEA